MGQSIMARFNERTAWKPGVLLRCRAALEPDGSFLAQGVTHHERGGSVRSLLSRGLRPALLRDE